MAGVPEPGSRVALGLTPSVVPRAAGGAATCASPLDGLIRADLAPAALKPAFLTQPLLGERPLWAQP